MKLTYTTPLVIALHILIGFFLIFFESEVKPPSPKKILAVRSVKLTPRSEKTVSIPETKVAESVAVAVAKKIEQPAIQKTAEVKPIMKVPVPIPKPKNAAKAEVKKKTPAPKVKEEVKQKSTEWIAKAKEKISKIGPTSSTIAQNSLKDIATPSTIGTLLSDLTFAEPGETLSAKESAYRDELAHRLKLNLKLPEYGEVEIKLTVGRSGKVMALKILKAQSKRNAAYLEKEVPKLLLPGFGNNFMGQETFDFTIRMSNE